MIFLKIFAGSILGFIVLHVIFDLYYSLYKLRDIANELEEIRKILEKKEGE